MIEQNSSKPVTSGKIKKGKSLLYFAGFLLLLFLLLTSFVMVTERELVLIERLGKITAVYDQESDKGLHWKLPWPIETIRRFDQRLQIYDPPGREFFTQDKKNILVDAYLCWKIAPAPENSGMEDKPVLKFFRSLGTTEVTEARLDSRLRSILSTQLGQLELSDLLDVTNSEKGPGDLAISPLDEIAGSILSRINQQENETESITSRLGIDIVDVRIKRINLPYGNQQAVFERMKSERKKIADRYRSAGQAENQMIRSKADRHYSELIAKANTESERIQSEAEAKALEILNESHAKDPEFYQLIQTLESYEKILNEKTSLILSMKNPLLKIFSEGIDLNSPRKKETSEKKKEEDKPSSQEPEENNKETESQDTPGKEGEST